VEPDGVVETSMVRSVSAYVETQMLPLAPILAVLRWSRHRCRYDVGCSWVHKGNFTVKTLGRGRQRRDFFALTLVSQRVQQH
jgi:hypothetical protein